MTFQYIIRTGELLRDGHLFMKGYAGRGNGKNNPAMTFTKDFGPLPCGTYTIGDPYDHPQLGPVCFNLSPDASNEMFGRSAFRIHADSFSHPGDASHGCIVSLGLGNYTGRSCREAIAAIVKGGDRVLRVVAEREDASWIEPPPNHS